MVGRSCFPPANFARASNKLNTCFARAPVRWASNVRTHLYWARARDIVVPLFLSSKHERVLCFVGGANYLGESVRDVS